MKDSSSASLPFTFDNLGIAGNERPEAGFVSFFRPKVAEIEEEEETAPEPPPSPEDQARKVFEDAYAQGEKAGRDMGMRRVDAIGKRLERHIEEVALFKKDLEVRYEKLAVELALKFAEVIILRECAEKREVLAAMVKKAMEICEEKGELVIRVRAEDARYIEDMRSDRIKVVADDTLKEPGFTIETRVGDIDGRISSQIEELRGALGADHE
jgi:flagellar assembly protein FliH